MTVLWTMITVVLVVELCILLILCAPLPWGVRKNISRFIFRVRAHERLEAFMRYIVFGLFIALLESVNSIRKVYLSDASKVAGEEGMDSSSQSFASNDYFLKKARAERNFYLALFSLTSCVTVARLVKLAWIEVQLRNKIKSYNGNKPLSETGETLTDDVKKK